MTNYNSKKDGEENMNRIFEWIKKHPGKTIFFIILINALIILGVPAIINICFKNAAPAGWLEAEWSAGDALGYYGDVLGFLGTVLLSALALYQNYEIKKASDEKQALIEEREYKKEMPSFRIKHLHCGGNFGDLSLTILNISSNIAYDLEVGNFKVEDTEGKSVCESRKVELKRKELLGNTETTVDFKNDSFSGNKLKFTFQMKCKDKFKDSHTYIVSSYIEDAERSRNEYKIIEI